MNRIDSESPSDFMGWLHSEAAVLCRRFWLAELASQFGCVCVNCALVCLANNIRAMCCTIAPHGASHCGLRSGRSLFRRVQRGLDNGRALQNLLHRRHARYIKALKRERARSRATRVEFVSRAGRATDPFADWELKAAGSASLSGVAGISAIFSTTSRT